jgi:hypothetical protein
MKNTKFDIDLKYGQGREERIRQMIEEGTIEVKTERDWWFKTGNIAIEYESFGKPSGIAKTEATYWAHVLANGKEDHCIIWFKTDKLKQLIKKHKHRTKNVGDFKKSKAYLIPINELFKL